MLPDDRFIDVHFADVVKDPVGIVRHVYEKLGETESAIQLWKKAVELEPERANWLPQLKNN